MQRDKTPTRAISEFILKRRTANATSTSALANYKRPKKLQSLKSFMMENGIASRMAPDLRQGKKKPAAQRAISKDKESEDKGMGIINIESI